MVNNHIEEIIENSDEFSKDVHSHDLELDISKPQILAHIELNHESFSKQIQINSRVEKYEDESESSCYMEFEPQHPSWFEFMRSCSAIFNNTKRNIEDLRINHNPETFHENNLHSGNLLH